MNTSVILSKIYLGKPISIQECYVLYYGEKICCIFDRKDDEINIQFEKEE